MPSERFDLYAFLASDATGRLAQLATVCPGALLFSLALRRGGAVDAAECAAVAIAEGRPLRWVLDALVDGWAECLAPRSTPPARMREVRLRQRLWIERAGPAVAAEWLLAPAPPLVPEDIPPGVIDNAGWYRSMSALAQLPVARDQAFESVARFVSRHSVVMADRCDVPGQLEEQCAQLVGYVRATGRRPGRRGDLGRVLDRAARFATFDVGALVELDAPLATRDEAAWSHGNVAIRPLRSVRELVAEAEAMHHCVAGRAARAVIGQVRIYSAQVGGERLTVELGEHLGCRELSEVRGFGNRPPTAEERRALWPWVERKCGGG